jgi:hypothetical protein
MKELISGQVHDLEVVLKMNVSWHSHLLVVVLALPVPLPPSDKQEKQTLLIIMA